MARVTILATVLLMCVCFQAAVLAPAPLLDLTSEQQSLFLDSASSSTSGDDSGSGSGSGSGDGSTTATTTLGTTSRPFTTQHIESTTTGAPAPSETTVTTTAVVTTSTVASTSAEITTAASEPSTTIITTATTITATTVAPTTTTTTTATTKTTTALPATPPAGKAYVTQDLTMSGIDEQTVAAQQDMIVNKIADLLGLPAENVVITGITFKEVARRRALVVIITYQVIVDAAQANDIANKMNTIIQDNSLHTSLKAVSGFENLAPITASTAAKVVAQTAPTDGDSENKTGLIVGLVVGLGGGLILITIIVVVVAKRNAHQPVEKRNSYNVTKHEERRQASRSQSVFSVDYKSIHDAPEMDA